MYPATAIALILLLPLVSFMLFTLLLEYDGVQCTSYYCGGAVNDVVGNDGPRFMTAAVGGLVVADGCVDAKVYCWLLVCHCTNSCVTNQVKLIVK